MTQRSCDKQCDTEHVASSVQRWIETVVIGLNLCPFAKREFARNHIRIHVAETETESELLDALGDELDLLIENPSVETTVIAIPNMLQDFYWYNLFLDRANRLIERRKLDGTFQLASFHPDYMFADADENDPANYSNRAPYPLLHILRESSLEKAINDYPDVDDIPERNIELLRAMGTNKLQALLKRCFEN